MKIDTSTWGLFQLGGDGGLFDIRKGKRLTAEDQTEGDTPYIGAIDSNNGVSNLIGQSPIHEGNTISLSYNGSVGEAFYQPEPYWATDDVNALYLRPEYGTLCPATALFVCSILKHDKYRYSYGRKWTLDKMKTTKIKLPATADGKPDWQWMESYIDSLRSKPVKTQNSARIASFDTTAWKWFQLGGDDGLFDIRKGKRLTAEDQTEGDTPYIGAIDSNNGVSNLIGQSPIHEGNTISLSYNGSVGEAFYQPEPYWATDDVNALYLRPEYGTLCPATALFVCSILKHDKYRYSYGRKWTLDKMKTTKIKLPATADGKPDWQWMENYIKTLPYGDRL